MGGLDRIARDAECAREHIGRTAWHDTERGLFARSVGEQAVDDLVDRPVAAVRDHEVDPLTRRVARHRERMAAVVGLDDLEFQLAGQRMRQHVAATQSGGCGLRVDDENRAHIRRVGQGAARPAGTANLVTAYPPDARR